LIIQNSQVAAHLFDMPSILRKFAWVLVFITPVLVFCQTVDPDYEVATWPGFTEAAVTYTFDDNCPNQYSVAIPMFNEFGFTATFFPVIDWAPQWAKFQDAVDLGHEIGSHTVSHPLLNELDLAAQEEELKNSKEVIESSISGQNGLTLAYPYCVPSDAALTRKYYIAARHCQGQIAKSTPANFYSISSIICGESGSIKTADNFKNNMEAAAKTSGWSVYLIHGIDGDGGYSSLVSSELRGSLEYLDENRDRFWVATFGKVVRYIRERNAISVTESENGSDTITLEMTDTLDNSVYDLPVTLRRTLPAGWGDATVTQNGDSVEYRRVVIGSEFFIEFNAVPDTGPIMIIKADNTSTRDMEDQARINIHPNPFSSEIRIRTTGEFKFRLFSISGTLIRRGTGSGEIMIGDNLAPGIYYLNVYCRQESLNQKIIKL
jgi:peptidoglycan/xylan/chitin deacetylase (PgdA/CDA1 family)